MLSYRHPALLTIAAVAALTCLQSPALRAADDPASLAAAVQRHYDGVRDFTADFVHAYTGGVLRKTVTERGRLRVKRPGLMRWNYTAPDRKEFVSDGRKMYSYIPADRQVYVSTVPQEDQASTPSLFLAGKGNIVRDFRVSAAELPAGAPPNTAALRLDPKHASRDYEWIVLVVDRASMEIRMLLTADQQGGQSTFTFSNVKENVGLADREFVFSIPRGADVITDTSRED